MKSCGEWFDLIVSREQHEQLKSVARMTTQAEALLWQEWFRNDPASGGAFAARMAVKRETGKWPKLEPYVLKAGMNGLSPDRIARLICVGIHGDMASAVANQVRKLYGKVRLNVLQGRERLPGTHHLRIRFRGRACRILPDESSPADCEWFKFAIPLDKESGRLVFGMKLKGASEFTRRWLRELAETGGRPSDGCISLVRRRGKWIWRLSLSRKRYAGERETLSRPIATRSLVVFAPLEQDTFLRCRIVDEKRRGGAPWQFDIEDADLLGCKRRLDEKRRRMGYSFRQSPESGRRGRGVTRRLDPSLRFGQRYENRVNSWIEQRSAYIVQSARKFRCVTIKMENLVEREPEKLRMGSFPYYRLLLRVEQKATEAGIEFVKLASFSQIESLLMVGTATVAQDRVKPTVI